MTQKRATLYALMRECAATERSVAEVWAWGRKQLNTGMAVPAQLGTIDVLSQRLFLQQQALLAPTFDFIQTLPAATRQEIQSRLPRHEMLPRLSSGSSSPALRGAGLGFLLGGVEIPAGVLIIGALLALAVVIAVLVFFFQSWEMVGDLVEDVQALRADAADAQRRLQTQQARYQDCLHAGGTPQSCAAEFPIPEPTTFFYQRQNRPSDVPEWVVGLAAVGGLVAVGGLLYVGVRAYRAASPYRALSEAVS